MNGTAFWARPSPMQQAEPGASPCNMTSMAKRYIGAALAAIVVFGFSGARTLADDAALTARVQAAYDGQCADIMRGDFAAFQQTLSPSFSATMNGRTVTRDDVVNALKSSAAQVTLTKCTTTIDSVAASGTAVIAFVHQVVDGTASGPQGTAPIEILAAKRDMWASAGNGLIQSSSMPIWSTTSGNGEIVQQSGTPPSPSASPQP